MINSGREQILNDSEEAFRIALDGRQSSMYTAMPGIVQAVDFATMTLTVQPAIKGRVADETGTETFVNLPLLIYVPICFPSAGGFTITLPITIGDEVLVVFASRCIDAWYQSGNIQKPMETRMHDLSDGFAIPGPRSLPRVVSGISSTALQIRNDDGSSYIEIGADGKIKLSASEIDVTGNLVVTGNIEASGSVKSGTVVLGTHTHSGVTTGGGNSGPPVP